MPSQKTRTTLAARFGQKVAVSAKAHAKDPVKFGRVELPGGVKGVARIVECYTGEFDDQTKQKQADGSSAKGQAYLRIVCAVDSPRQVTREDGSLLNIFGHQESLLVPICEKGAAVRGDVLDFDGLIAEAGNELRKCMGEDFDTSDMDRAIAMVAKVKPFINFSTTTSAGAKIDPKTQRPYPPRVWFNFNGCKGLEDYKPQAVVGGGMREAPSANGTANPAFDEFKKPDEAPDDVDPKDPEDDDGLDALAERADPPSSEDDAQKELDTLADELGIADETAAASSYAEVVQLIRDKRAEAGDGDAPADEPEPFVAEKGVVYDLEVLKDAKNPKKGTKTVEVEVTKVDKKAETCEAKDSATKKPLLDGKGQPLSIPWDSLVVKA